ncbi:MAG: FAD-binding oxidoreductase [Colwellia sp.]
MKTVSDTRNFARFSDEVAKILTTDNIISRYIQRFAYGGDASFYRLVPRIVLRIDNESQLISVLCLATTYQLPVTFRAAGTSLSGQAITDSILIILSPKWNKMNIHHKGEKISLQPGIIGAQANQALAKYSRKIGPDPASINSCKIGGIAANNASGMCCGVKDNSYHTLFSMQLIFADGFTLNTADLVSRSQFKKHHVKFINELMAIVVDVKKSPALVDKIKHKYRLKNTTGYGINALIDYQEPIDIISHLMIGSEGTLGFISEITYNTVEILPHKATGLYIFEDMQTACYLVEKLANETVDAVEIMDGRALNSVRKQLAQLVDLPKILSEQHTALLIEFSADSTENLVQLESNLTQHINCFAKKLLTKQNFTANSILIEKLWKIRKGMFPAVGAVRETGTTVIIEDVALPLNLLAQGVEQLHQLFIKFGYRDAIIFGHALAGNLHFVFTQAFDQNTDVNRYHDFMAEVTKMVAIEYQGSLKAEHGTGRNMAPFVEMEWGNDLYKIMQRLKKLFDPQNILNPGVIINNDKNAHIKHLKIMAPTEKLIDKCIECGFCESVCPSLNFTLTPRQRIAVWRQIALLNHKKEQHRLDKSEQQQLIELEKDYQYFGVDSCAATGLCGQQCPVAIDTGNFILGLRQQQATDGITSKLVAKHFSSVTEVAKVALNMVSLLNKIVGNKVLYKAFSLLNKVSGNLVPKWYEAWPKGAKQYKLPSIKSLKPVKDLNECKAIQKVVYIPSCSNRIFAADSNSIDQRPLPQVIHSLLNKANIDVIIPSESKQLCCGMPWFSKGLNDTANEKRQAFIHIINKYSEQGKWPVVTDASPCASTIISADKNTSKAAVIYEATQFIAQHVLNKLTINKSDETFMLHTTCSSKKMDEGFYLKKIAHACSRDIIIPKDIYCCGFAGDKGFYLPQLTKSALAPLKNQIPKGCTRGLSNSRTCEVGLSEQSQISYQSVLYLLDQLTD